MNKALGNHRTCRVVITDERGRVLLKGKCINGYLSQEILHSPIYLELIEREPELTDIYKFMRRYSEDHRRKYPLNAVYNGIEFYLAKGKEQHRPALELFEQFKTDTGGDFEAFRKVVQ